VADSVKKKEKLVIGPKYLEGMGSTALPEKEGESREVI